MPFFTGLFAALLAFCLLTATAQAASVKIQNATSWQIDRVYISPSNASAFGNDRLGEEQVIGSGETWTFQWIAGGVCFWDFRVVFHQGFKATLYHQNLCEYDSPIWRV